jgi:hypothetical protein
VVYTILKTFHCDFGTSNIIGVLWLQTLISLFAMIYVCIPGLKMVTKILYFHLLPTFLLLCFSVYVSLYFLGLETECNVYGHDMKMLISAMYFSQGIVPIISIIILSNDLMKCCQKRSVAAAKKPREFSNFRDDEDD